MNWVSTAQAYERAICNVALLVRAERPDSRSVENLASALRTFLRLVGHSIPTVIGPS